MSDREPKLSASNRNYVGSTAFADDRLDRKPLAEKLTSYLERLNDGAVLAIDAPWGEGKTWFGKNWAKHLEDNDYKVIYIDAFEQDYIEDPFMLLTSEIINIIEDGDDIGETLKKSGVEITKALLPIGAKALLNFGSKVLLGSSDISEDIKEALEDGTNITSELTSEWIKESLEAHTHDKGVMQEFKTQLTAYADKQDKPIVIFIDELDRCKPNFAVNLVERIKHFFDVPNIVFVLLLNREQLEKAVKGVYGSETNASAYLGKFVNFFFALPKPIRDGLNYDNRLQTFINATMNKYNFTRDGNSHDGFTTHLKVWAFYFDMSLRDIEKAVALYSFSGEVNWVATYLIVFKVKKPNLFKKLVFGDIEAHQEAKKMIEEFIKISNLKKLYDENYLIQYLQWHEAYLNNFTEVGDGFLSLLQGHYRYTNDPSIFLPNLAKSIDLQIN
jgi:KAP-like P-loop domain-containing protein